MCIRDRGGLARADGMAERALALAEENLLADRRHIGRRLDTCLLYTSDAADERSSVDLGGRRIIKKKKKQSLYEEQWTL